MKIANHTPQTLLDTLVERIKDIEQRERIVIKFPFAHQINRIEIYCSETEPKDTAGTMFGGSKFNGILSLQVFTDYTNKPTEKSSYTYQREFFNYLPTLIEKLFKHLEVATK